MQQTTQQAGDNLFDYPSPGSSDSPPLSPMVRELYSRDIYPLAPRYAFRSPSSGDDDQLWIDSLDLDSHLTKAWSERVEQLETAKRLSLETVTTFGIEIDEQKEAARKHNQSPDPATTVFSDVLELKIRIIMARSDTESDIGEMKQDLLQVSRDIQPDLCSPDYPKHVIDAQAHIAFLVPALEDAKAKLHRLCEQVEEMKRCQASLRRQRFVPGEGWIWEVETAP